MSEGVNLNLPTAPKGLQEEQKKSPEEVIREKEPELLEGIPPQQKARIAKFLVHQESLSIVRSSPLPAPSELAAYSAIIPNGADRIMKMAEAQSTHRIEIEKIVIKSQQSQAFRGQVFGLTIGLAGLFCATYAALNGQPWFGGSIGSATLVSLVSAFVYAQQQKKQDLGQKQEAVASQPAKRGKRR